MANHAPSDILITGIGLLCPLGVGIQEAVHGLMAGTNRFGLLRREGRQSKDSAFIGAELPAFDVPDRVSAKELRTTSLSTRAALVALEEAWAQARLDTLPAERVGLIVGGSNFQQRELTLVHDAYRGREAFVRPSYAQTFMDSDLTALCCEAFGIRGPAHTLGGASASGLLAVMRAIEVVEQGQADACIALGALMDLSYWECQAFRSLGAMGSDRHHDAPARACRPFDRLRDGFIYGENCGAVVVQSTASARGNPWARVTGWACDLDSRRGTDPSLEGEVRAIESALARARWTASDIDYVNPHGTGSVVGDEIELRALDACHLTHARINATKSLLGHGLSAAGTVELIATLLQMRAGRLHPSLNLQEPIDQRAWVRGQEAEPHRIQKALKLSFGFGGLSTAMCLEAAA